MPGDGRARQAALARFTCDEMRLTAGQPRTLPGACQVNDGHVRWRRSQTLSDRDRGGGDYRVSYYRMTH